MTGFARIRSEHRAPGRVSLLVSTVLGIGEGLAESAEVG